MASTKQSQSVTKNTRSFSLRKIIYVFGILLIGLGLTVQVALDMHFWRAAQYTTDESIVSMITQAVQTSNKPAVMEPATKKVYLPDADIVLPPAPNQMPNLLYNYVPSTDGNDAEANVTVTNAVNVGISKLRSIQNETITSHDSDRIFAVVPDLQACVRGVHVVFGTKAKYEHMKFAKQLKDGREMFIYTESHPCSYDLEPLVEYLRGAESY